MQQNILLHSSLIMPDIGLNSIFKLADRMRSMRTNGASKNRDSSCFLIARLARSDPRNRFSVLKNKKLPRAIYSILAYFTMFSFQVLTCSRIVSIHIILNLNKFRQVETCSDMFENHENSYHIESEQVQTCFNMFRHV